MLKYLRTPKNDPIRVQYSQIKNEIAVNKHLYPFNNGYGITKTLKTGIYSESKLSIFKITMTFDPAGVVQKKPLIGSN